MKSFPLALSATLCMSSIAYSQNVTYQKNLTSTGSPVYEFASSFVFKQVRNSPTSGASISGSAKANINYALGAIKPYSISYLMTETIYNPTSFITISGGILDPYTPNGSVIERNNIQLSLGPSNPIKDLAYKLEVQLRGANVSRQGQTWQASNGIYHGNTIYSYKEEHLNIFGSYIILDANWQNFSALSYGIWDTPNYFNWAPEYSGATKIWNKIQMPVAGMFQLYDLDVKSFFWCKSRSLSPAALPPAKLGSFAFKSVSTAG